MSAQDNKRFIEQYLAALSGNPKPPSLVAKYVDDAELAHHIEIFEEAFPAYELLIDDIFGEGDKVVIRTTFRGTHQGNLFGIPPSQKQVSISVMLIYRIANGKIVEHWMNADSLSLMQQIGAVPVPG